MPASSKPKKKYRPKGIIRNPIAYVIEGINPPSPEKATQVQVSYHWSMTNLTKGTGTIRDWQAISNSLNLTMVLAEMGWGENYIGQIREAMYALAAMRDRYKAGKPLRFTGPELQEINDALALHDEQVRMCPVKVFEKAIADADARIARKEFLQPRQQEAA